MVSTFSFPTKIVFGPGAIESVADTAKSFSIKRPLIVTDPGIVKSGLLDRLTDVLKRANLDWSLFADVEANPTEQSVFPGVERYKSDNCTLIRRDSRREPT